MSSLPSTIDEHFANIEIQLKQDNKVNKVPPKGGLV